MLHIIHIIKLLLIIAFFTIISIFFGKLGIGKESIIMVFLLGVLLVNVTTRGYLYGVLASIMSVLTFNYFFTDPVHTLTTYNTSDVILMFSFLIASILSGTMTKMFQKQMLISKQNEHTARLLYKVTENFLNITGEKNILLQGIKTIYDNTRFNNYIVLSERSEVFKDEDQIQNKNNIIFMEVPIIGLTKKLGVICIYYPDYKLSLENELLIKTVAAQVGLSLDREFVYDERQKICIAMEKEELRSSLLRAISHDLRTPLTGIIGASRVVIDNLSVLDKTSIEELVTDINEEALWLNNLVENILNMTRIGEGKLLIEKKYEVVDDVISEAIKHVRHLSKNKKITISLPDTVTTLLIDGKLIVQVLINLLDNAIKHTPDYSHIFLRVYTTKGFVIFQVADDGKGIDPSIQDDLFESFVTLSSKTVDGKKDMGLGLAICKSIVEAHGGSISSGQAPEGGALFEFTIPLTEEV